MAYDEGLAERVRGLLSDEAGVVEKRMFGGLAFLLRGNMCVGVVKQDLLVRVGPEACQELLRQPHTREMTFTGRPFKAFLLVDAAGLEADAELQRWVGRGVAFAGTLPRK